MVIYFFRTDIAEGRRKKEEGRRKKEEGIKGVLTSTFDCYIQDLRVWGCEGDAHITNGFITNCTEIGGEGDK
ncbi:MAG: hypothetical protein ACRCT1_19050 [Microcoleaceae cyanobacterium]